MPTPHVNWTNAAGIISARTDNELLLVTRGALGMAYATLHQKNRDTPHMPAFEEAEREIAELLRHHPR